MRKKAWTGIVGIAAVALWPSDGAGMTISERMNHRHAVRMEIANRTMRAGAIAAALKDEDAAIRRYALAECAKDLEGNPAARAELGGLFKDDPEPEVRRLAKGIMCARTNARVNEPLSLSPRVDYAPARVQTAERKGNTYRFTVPRVAYDAVELWLGAPKDDLYVWVNDVYVGQFDKDLQAGREFRLDVTRETKVGDENVVVVRDKVDRVIDMAFSAEALKW